MPNKILKFKPRPDPNVITLTFEEAEDEDLGLECYPRGTLPPGVEPSDIDGWDQDGEVISIESMRP